MPSIQKYTYRLAESSRLLQRMCSSDQASLRRPIVDAESPPAPLPSNATSASSKSPVEIPLRKRIGISTSRLFERRAYGGRIADEKRMRSEPSPTRSRTRGQRTVTRPMPVTISRSGKCPWRTSRWRPSSVVSSAYLLSKLATSASTACASSARAPSRNTYVSGWTKLPGWESWKTLVSVTAYHSFAGEVEALNTPTIRRLTPSRRHQLSTIAPDCTESTSVGCYGLGRIALYQMRLSGCVLRP